MPKALSRFVIRLLAPALLVSALVVPVTGCTGSSREIIGGAGVPEGQCPPGRRRVGNFCKTSLDNS